VDITVLQECDAPAAIDDQCAYFKVATRKGVGVVTKLPWRVEAAPQSEHVTGSAYPVMISGPQTLHLLAIWAHPTPTYVRSILGALDHYGDFLRSAPSLIVGDFNSHTFWDYQSRTANHSVLVRRLDEEFGLVSAFHAFAERDGRPEPPTYFHRRKEAEPFHLDYCFIPKSWVPQLKSVEIGNYVDWATQSDHRPVVIDVGGMDF
jgi:hypothetical protein